jgi:hypothetical protein
MHQNSAPGAVTLVDRDVAGTRDYMVLESEGVGVDRFVCVKSFRAVGIVVATHDDRRCRRRSGDGGAVDTDGNEGAVGGSEGGWSRRGDQGDAIDALLFGELRRGEEPERDAATVRDDDAFSRSELSEFAVQDGEPFVESR